MGEVVEVVEAHTLRMCRRHPVELRIEGRCVPVLVDEIEKRAADTHDCGHLHRLAGSVVRLRAPPDGVAEGVVGIGDAPAHRGRAGPVVGHEPGGMAARFGIDEIADIALLPDLDGLRPVLRDARITLPGKDIAQRLRVLVGERHEGEAVGSGGVVVADFGIGGVVGERSHGHLLCLATA